MTRCSIQTTTTKNYKISNVICMEQALELQNKRSVLLPGPLLWINWSELSTEGEGLIETSLTLMNRSANLFSNCFHHKKNFIGANPFGFRRTKGNIAQSRSFSVTTPKRHESVFSLNKNKRSEFEDVLYQTIKVKSASVCSYPLKLHPFTTVSFILCCYR